MLRNYLTIALRNLLRNKVYSFINITGLATGLAVSMLILLFVSHEFSYDKFHKNREKLYRILGVGNIDGKTYQFNHFSSKLAPIMKEDNPEILDFVRLRTFENRKSSILNPLNPTQVFAEKGFAFADNSFFNILDFPLQQGNKHQALIRPFTMVISERMAKKYFGKENPVGKTLIYENKHKFEITGVAKDFPSNSSFNFDFIASLSSVAQLDEENKRIWEVAGAFETYLLLNDPQSLEKVQKNILAAGKKTGAFDNDSQYVLEQFARLHLYSRFVNNDSLRFIYIFSGVAVLILFLALFNYISLTTARSANRAKEIGIRKVIGANRNVLIRQFYLESVLVSVFSFLLAFVLVELLRQPFYEVLGLTIDASFLKSPVFLSVLLTLLLVTTFVAGAYPALFLSGFSPVEVLKGRWSSKMKGASLRKFLMVFQFTVSVGLIVCSMVIMRQVNYMKDKELGFHKDQILTLKLPEALEKNYLPFKNEISQLTGVENITASGTPFFKGYNLWFVANKKTKKDVSLVTLTGDKNFLKTFDLKWKIKPADLKLLDLPNKIVINELAIEQLGLKNNPVGETILLGNTTKEIIGVLQNFHYTSTKSKIEAMMLNIISEKSISEYGGNVLYIRFLPSADLQAQLAAIKTIFQKYNQDQPFDYYFLDEAFNESFKTEIRMGKMFSVFTGFAIFIACMGLFGLATFSAEQRTKEIGIRKVLGASVSQIVSLLSKDFLKLVFLAFVIAVPMAWYAMNQWLQDFAYRVEIQWWIFAMAGVLTLLIALLTVSFQAIKAALANPVKSLRTE